MATLVEISEAKDLDLYEPSVQDKVLRIIYRLENGEQLITSYLHDPKEDKFCVLGLFADESGLGKWVGASYVAGDGTHQLLALSNEVYQYYGLSNNAGNFDINDLPNDVRNRVNCLHYDWSGNIVLDYLRTLTMYYINDIGHSTRYPYINQLLADIIRSGAIFKQDKET